MQQALREMLVFVCVLVAVSLRRLIKLFIARHSLLVAPGLAGPIAPDQTTTKIELSPRLL